MLIFTLSRFTYNWKSGRVDLLSYLSVAAAEGVLCVDTAKVHLWRRTQFLALMTLTSEQRRGRQGGSGWICTKSTRHERKVSSFPSFPSALHNSLLDNICGLHSEYILHCSKLRTLVTLEAVVKITEHSSCSICLWSVTHKPLHPIGANLIPRAISQVVHFEVRGGSTKCENKTIYGWFVWLFSAVCFQMSPQIACLRGCIIDWLHLFDFSPLWDFKCVFKLLAWEDA